MARVFEPFPSWQVMLYEDVAPNSVVCELSLLDEVDTVVVGPQAVEVVVEELLESPEFSALIVSPNELEELPLSLYNAESETVVTLVV